MKRTRKPIRIVRHPPHINSLKTNFQEIDRIIEIHGEISGSGPGYKHNVQVLNKSAIVLLLACWEAYIEDLMTNPETKERLAREEYYMSKENEDVFIIQEESENK